MGTCPFRGRQCVSLTGSEREGSVEGHHLSLCADQMDSRPYSCPQKKARALEAEKSLAVQEAVATTARDWRAQMEEELAAVAAKAAEVCRHVLCGVVVHGEVEVYFGDGAVPEGRRVGGEGWC